MVDEKKCSPRTRLIGTSTRAQLSRTCVTPRTFRAHRPDRSMRKVTEREAPIGVLCPSTGRPVGAGGEIAMDQEIEGERRTRCVTRARARVQQRGRSTASIVASGTLLLQTT